MVTLPRTAVIGAGSSGIVALKALVEKGIPAVCFEKGDRVGGNWVFQNSNGMSSSYRSLHINTSRERMEYSDFPMPKSYPDFPHHTHIAEYFDSYVDHFDLRRHIRFCTAVERAERCDGGGWRLTLDDGSVEEFDVLVVANGHHWDPRWPEPAFPGSESFPGVQLHAHDFEDNTAWRDRSVLVVGMGNSAMDISVEASWVARRTYLAARTPVHVVPKYVFGRPLDQVETPALARRLPWQVRQRLTAGMLKAVVGSYERYGLRTPSHGMLQAHITVSDTILTRLAHGAVVAKPNLSRFEGSEAVFEDGTRAHVDVVVYATGYRITFPFFDEELVSAQDNQISLFNRVFHPDMADLAFIGLVQPLGAIMPIAEEQGRLVADHLAGTYALPSREEMQRAIDRTDREVRARYIGSKRHTIQVDFDRYLHALRTERRRGARRAGVTV
ncbi:NAD(P)-binding domain-containing protein [soil metagenome]